MGGWDRAAGARTGEQGTALEARSQHFGWRDTRRHRSVTGFRDQMPGARLLLDPAWT